MKNLSIISDHKMSFQSSMKDEGKEAVFPFGLGRIGVHECIESAFGDMGAVTGFALANTRPEGAILWIRQYKLQREHGTVLPNSLVRFQKAHLPGLSIRVSRQTDTLWAIEEGIKSSAVNLIIAEVEDADFTATRRLKIASERYGVPVILLMPHTRLGVSACETRWRIRSLPSAPNHYDEHAPGRPQWRATLERCRSAPHFMGKVFDLEYDHETISVRMVSPMVAGSAKTGKTSPTTKPENTFRQIA